MVLSDPWMLLSSIRFWDVESSSVLDLFEAWSESLLSDLCLVPLPTEWPEHNFIDGCWDQRERDDSDGGGTDNGSGGTDDGCGGTDNASSSRKVVADGNGKVDASDSVTDASDNATDASDGVTAASDSDMADGGERQGWWSE